MRCRVANVELESTLSESDPMDELAEEGYEYDEP